MESIPVVGVDTRNAIVDAFEAPSFLKPAAIGITLQEHTGSGMPKSVDFKTGINPEPPK